jgi:hypothetical protein
MTSKRHTIGADTSLGGEPAMDAGDGFCTPATAALAAAAAAAPLAFELVGADTIEVTPAGAAATLGACV